MVTDLQKLESIAKFLNDCDPATRQHLLYSFFGDADGKRRAVYNDKGDEETFEVSREDITAILAAGGIKLDEQGNIIEGRFLVEDVENLLTAAGKDYKDHFKKDFSFDGNAFALEKLEKNYKTSMNAVLMPMPTITDDNVAQIEANKALTEKHIANQTANALVDKVSKIKSIILENSTLPGGIVENFGNLDKRIAEAIEKVREGKESEIVSEAKQYLTEEGQEALKKLFDETRQEVIDRDKRDNYTPTSPGVGTVTVPLKP